MLEVNVTLMFARSKCNIDVGEILSGVQNATFPREEGEPIVQSGGGNKQSAGGNITTNDIFAVEKFLTDSVLQYATPEEEKEEKPVVLVRKQRKVSVYSLGTFLFFANNKEERR